MLGRDHALSGAVVFAALAPSLHVTVAHLAAGVVLTAGRRRAAGHRPPGLDDLPVVRVPDRVVRLGGGPDLRRAPARHAQPGRDRGVHRGRLRRRPVPAVRAEGGRGGHSVFSWHIVPAALVLALLYSAALRALHIGGHHGDLLGIAARAGHLLHRRGPDAAHGGLLARPAARGGGRARLRGAHRGRRADARRLPAASGRRACTSSTCCRARCRSRRPSCARPGSSSRCCSSASRWRSGTRPATRSPSPSRRSRRTRDRVPELRCSRSSPRPSSAASADAARVGVRREGHGAGSAQRPAAGSLRSKPNRCDQPSGTLRLLITRAGLPAAREFGGMSRVTTECPAITDPEPMVTPGRTVTLPASHTLSPMMVGPL